MPRYFDHVQIHEAVSNQAMPVLQAMAANDNLRSLRRFERDEPPAYASSTESEGSEGLEQYLPLSSQQRRELEDRVKATMDPPLDDRERSLLAGAMESVVRPDDVYYSNATREYARLEDRCLRNHRPEIFLRLKGSRRQGVIVRHNLKRRWEKLGIWNPEWGFAGRKRHPRDDFRTWQWPWQHQGLDINGSYAYELVKRALDQRRHLKRGERGPVPSMSHLRKDATTAEGEAFLISRPWFLWQIELNEERTRYRRLSIEDQRRHPREDFSHVVEWWKERGDWRPDFDNKSNWITAWKWRHESPSPEPEDLAPVDSMRDSPLEAAAEMEFTPSEIDDLETIELPDDELPEPFWTVDEDDMPPYFPGQMVDQGARVRKEILEWRERRERAKAEGYESPAEENRDFFGVFDIGDQNEKSIPEELETSAGDVPRPHARITSMRRPAEPLSSQVVPARNKLACLGEFSMAHTAKPHSSILSYGVPFARRVAGNSSLVASFSHPPRRG
ncbi:hypothetical protein F5Y14DRAFT_464907 [Nemania sp. NC0429]|nr:hypothetical protein F5Y14DRAFT_464907 [Nemania sp. NC0429]